MLQVRPHTIGTTCWDEWSDSNRGLKDGGVITSVNTLMKRGWYLFSLAVEMHIPANTTAVVAFVNTQEQLKKL